MTGRARTTTSLIAVVCATAIAPPEAVAGGGPSALVGAAPEGAVESSDGERRYAVSWQSSGSLVRSIDPATGRTVARLRLSGPYGLSYVANDGTLGGLSHDGSTLVAASPSHLPGKGRSRFAVIDTDALRVTKTVTLKGSFGYDALSPDARWLYLVQAHRGPGAYSVRAYDLSRDRLLPKAIIDPREKPVEMWGFPMARASSPDGRYEYTLYDGDEHDFIHALDTANREARCIDLPQLPAVPANVGVDVSPDGRSLSLGHSGREVASVDLVAHEARLTSEPQRNEQRAGPATASSDGGSFPWLPVVLALGALAAVGLTARRAAATRTAAP